MLSWNCAYLSFYFAWLSEWCVCNNLTSVVAYLFSAKEGLGYQHFKQLPVSSSEHRYESVGGTNAGAHSFFSFFFPPRLKGPSGAFVFCCVISSSVSPVMVHVLLTAFGGYCATYVPRAHKDSYVRESLFFPHKTQSVIMPTVNPHKLELIFCSVIQKPKPRRVPFCRSFNETFSWCCMVTGGKTSTVRKKEKKQRKKQTVQSNTQQVLMLHF